MSLIMLAIGGLLTLIGVYAIATGLPVIEIERGWSMVIAGSVLLSGGLIIAALGIVVRTLNGLKGGLVAPSADPVPNVTPAFAPPPHEEPAIATHAFTVRPPAPVPAATESAPAFAVAAPAAAAVLAAGAGYASTHRDTSRHEPREPKAEPVHEPASEAQAPQPAFPDAPMQDHVDHAPVDLAPADHALADPAPADHAAEPLSHDWLEKEFAAFDLDAPHEPAATQAPEPPHAEPADPEPPPPEPHAETPAPEPPEPAAAGEPEPAPEPASEAPSTAPEAPDGNLSVIGRYDSEGTSYVMYSDGSIEAQSEAGVFRFGSMAELKAFIEG